MMLPDMNLTQAMDNITNTVNASVLGQFGTIPKRVPIDNVQWMRSGVGDVAGGLTRDEVERLYGERDFSFYLILTLLTLGFVSGILFLYICFCAWAMKGNMDLPLPGGGFQKTAVIKFVNPFKRINMSERLTTIPASLASILRYNKYQAEPQHYPQPPNNQQHPQPGGLQGGAYPGGPQQSTNPNLAASDVMVVPVGETTNRMIPTISSSQQQFQQQPQRQNSLHATNDQSCQKPAPQPTKLFDSKAMALPNSFKQFQQFRYDPQMDDEPEQVVFDIFDPQ